MKIHRALIAFAIACGIGTSITSAQPATAPSVDMANGEILGPRFESLGAGIALRPPAGMKTTRGSIGSQEVVRFVNDTKKWALILTRVQLDDDKPLPLTTWMDAKSKPQQGMLQVAIEQFKAITPGAQILKEDVDDTGKIQMGFLAGKYNMGMETNLAQEAVIRASNLRYYILTLTSPAPRTGELEEDKSVQEAVIAFRNVTESVELLDQSGIRQDQEDRLFRTRALYVNLTEKKIRSAVQKEQWFRLIQDGKDVGYRYIIQEIARGIPRKGRPEVQNGPEGVLVGVRSRLLPEPGVQIDAESWAFNTFDRKYESFSSIIYGQDPKKGKSTSGEVGLSVSREKPVKSDAVGLGANREMIQSEVYRLEVTRIGENVSSAPVVRDLPPFYLPQAMYQLLPQLVLPSREPKSYLFASWITDAGQVIHRYIDVEAEREVGLAGKRMRAIPIKDRVGLEGSVTMHYVTPDGKYLGSDNEESKLTIVATDAAALEKLWKDANLSRPGEVEQK